MHSKNYLLLSILLILSGYSARSQQLLTLKQAIETGVKNYGTIKAKSAYAAATEATVVQSRREYLPNLNVSAQQDYGTINGQSGPLYGFGGLAVASAGPALPAQNWNAAFGALYLTNVNWDFFAFGRAKEKIRTAEAAYVRDSKDLDQEIFKHEVRVAAAYLNLLAAQQLTRSYQKNLDRADTFRQIITVKALNGLVAGVDSSQANAEYSNAKITLTRARDLEQEQNAQLVQLLGVVPQHFLLDSYFVSRIPAIPAGDVSPLHPALQWYKSRIDVSNEQARYLRTFNYPAFSLVGVLQTRGSGFGNTYPTVLTDFNTGYTDGVSPSRTNYLFGIGVTWNLTQPLRISQAVRAQRLTSEGLEAEYDMAAQQIRTQYDLAEAKIKFALDNYREVGTQVKAASDAYTQKSVLYRNGLTNLVDLTQALYALVRAETDRDIAYSNVWQALLLKAAAVGDINVFESQL